MTIKIRKFILPTPTEFIRYIAQAILFNTKENRDTTVKVPPLVTRAKALVAKSGLIEAGEEREEL